MSPAADEREVLVVEDVAVERKVLAETVRKAGYTVTAVSRGRDAVRAIDEGGGRFGIILLDMRLPDISGLEVFRAVRHLAPGVKVILCPGLVDSEETRAALAEGADGCLPKPLDFRQVVSVVRSHLGPRGGLEPTPPPGR